MYKIYKKTDKTDKLFINTRDRVVSIPNYLHLNTFLPEGSVLKFIPKEGEVVEVSRIPEGWNVCN